MRRVQAALFALVVGAAMATGGGAPAYANNQHPGNATMRVHGGGPVVAAEEFSDAGWQGSLLTATDPYDCFEPETEYRVNVPTSPAWNDIISSVQMFAGCDETLWDNSGCSGANYYIPANARVSIGAQAINDHTTCITFYIFSG